MSQDKNEVADGLRPVVTVDNSPAGLMRLGTAAGMKLDELERMYALQREWESDESKKAFVKAMAAFKANPPEILKTKHVSYYNNKNQLVEWDHAELGEICEAIIAQMSPYELYHRWDMEQPDKDTVKTTCIITHSSGHSIQTSMKGPPDTSGGKDAWKAVASTNTIQQRLTLLSLTGLAAKGMDTENTGSALNGNSDIEFVTKDQVTEMEILIEEKNIDLEKLLAHWKVESLDRVQKSDFSTCMRALKKAAPRPEKTEREPGSEG